jgi:hypothetical protein
MNRYDMNMAHLAAQAHGLYLRLRDRAGDADHATVMRAYHRYQRRLWRMGGLNPD